MGKTRDFFTQGTNSRKPGQRELSSCPSSDVFFRNQGVSPEKEQIREGHANCLDGVKAVVWKRNRLTLQRSRGQAFNQGRFSRVQLCVTPETAAHQVPPSLGFSRQEHWSGLPFPSPMHEREK